MDLRKGHEEQKARGLGGMRELPVKGAGKVETKRA